VEQALFVMDLSMQFRVTLTVTLVVVEEEKVSGDTVTGTIIATPGTAGNNSTFATIPSTGGGFGSRRNLCYW
jgi:hypothetical protein